MADFNLTKMAVNMYCPGNVAQLDDAGLPSLLVWIPAFRLCDVLNTTDESVHPAFIVNGVQIPGFWYSKYQNVVHNGKAYSLPGEDPAVNVNFDTAREYCEAKGYGWHMSTAAEWAAIALWCKNNGTMPKGNNNRGKDIGEINIKAVAAVYDNSGNPLRVATGTGPLTWSHDQSMSGIWDMNGNVEEWQSGIRIVWGELQILARNDAADPDNPQNSTSTCWKAINAADGTFVEPECNVTGSAVLNGNTVRLDYVNNVWTYSNKITSAVASYRSCAFGKITFDSAVSDAAKLILRALALLPDSNAAESDYALDLVYWNNGKSECLMTRGGSCDGNNYVGIFCINGNKVRSANSADTGFRAAYIPNI